MPIPRVAIVGRPNVGKSSLMNMLARAKVSIVDPTPGVTRDRVSAIVLLEHPDARGPVRPIEFVDTGGFGVYTAEGERYDDVGEDLAQLTGSIESQIAAAVRDADLVLFAVDAQAGVTPQDEEIARLLREQRLGRPTANAPRGARDANARRVPVRVVATKVDGPRWETHALEMSALGFDEPLMVSAKNNYMRRDLFDALYFLVPHTQDENTPAPHADMKFAIIGKRNAGKSTLVNTLAGEPRMIVSEIAGTTRDAVDVRFEMDGKVLVAIDTAGLRKKKSFAGPVEWYAFDRLKLSVDRADVVLLLIDATTPVSQVDQQVAMLAQKAFKPTIIVVNKWDLAEGKVGPKGKKIGVDDYEQYLRREMKGLWYAPISFISGETGRNVRETIDLAIEMHQQASLRVTTGKLNRMVGAIVERNGPPSKIGAHAKLYYVAQTGVNPPTIVMVVNKPELFTANYQRFLLNRFREELPFTEVPIRLVIRGKRREEAEADRAQKATPVVDPFGSEDPFEISEPGIELPVEGEGVELSHAPAASVEENDSPAEPMDLGDDADAYFDDQDEPNDSEVEDSSEGGDAADDASKDSSDAAPDEIEDDPFVIEPGQGPAAHPPRSRPAPRRPDQSTPTPRRESTQTGTRGKPARPARPSAPKSAASKPGAGRDNAKPAASKSIARPKRDGKSPPKPMNSGKKSGKLSESKGGSKRASKSPRSASKNKSKSRR
ncbi:MAG: ribosome biogenesis GTPase Der [Phycisphaerales bacterium]|jgi:GTP-binding protein|nr:ribosome biogenesis GTPase Der [Phycisphaerales bacterium]